MSVSKAHNRCLHSVTPDLSEALVDLVQTTQPGLLETNTGKVNKNYTSSYFLTASITTVFASVLWRVLSVPRPLVPFNFSCLFLQHVCLSVCYGWPKVPCYSMADQRGPNMPLRLSPKNDFLYERREGKSEWQLTH